MLLVEFVADGRKVESFDVGDGTKNILVSWGSPKVVFCSHLDTVPPYISPKFSDDRVEGRGTCDAKGQIFAMWEACLELERRGCSDFALLLLAGEETGSFGAKAFSEKAAAVGFDWESAADVWDKVNEEIREIEHEIKVENKDNLEAEFGDLFFALINACRKYGIDPENALERTNKKFIERFNHLEKRVAEQGKMVSEASLEELESYWQEAKH